MVFHELPPVCSERSKVLILGSFPSPKSRETGFYYGHPQNRFWKVLAAVFGETTPTAIEEKKAFLFAHDIALWDVIASCEIVGAGDSTIRDAVPNDFSVICSAAKIKAVFTTGKTAAKLYKKFTGSDSIVLPSPSPANCAVSMSDMVKEYEIIKQLLSEEK